MTEPDGRLPRWVYWRRRAVAVAGTVAVLLSLIWLLGQLAEHDQPDARGMSAQSPSTPPSTPLSTTAGPSASPSSAAPSLSGGSVPGSLPPSPASLPGTPPPAPPPGPPQPCPDAAIRLTAEVDRAEYAPAQRPEFRIVVTNAGPVPCVRDVSRRLRELVVNPLRPGNRLWSSNDCYAGDSDGPRVLQPGERVAFAVTWARRTSAVGCPAGRNTVPAGDYLLVARLGGLTSAPVLFRLRDQPPGNR